MGELFSWLMSETGLASGDLGEIIRTAPRRYKVYSIEKRSGGQREIAQPAKELKYLQYCLIERLGPSLELHACATAYRRGKSILDNAASHSGSSAILKMDFKDFFPSIHGVDWRNYCHRRNLLDIEDIEISSMILFRKAKGEKTLKLSIGAPSSPLISNAMMYDFDEYVSAKASKRHLVYTRYADDITFSGQRIGILRDMLKVVPAAIRATRCAKLHINHEKTNFVTTKYSRNVTGLVLGNGGEVGIGREKRRLLRARVHRALQGNVPQEELLKLSGYLSFTNSVDSSAVAALRKKYGEVEISRLMSLSVKSYLIQESGERD